MDQAAIIATLDLHGIRPFRYGNDGPANRLVGPLPESTRTLKWSPPSREWRFAGGDVRSYEPQEWRHLTSTAKAGLRHLDLSLILEYFNQE